MVPTVKSAISRILLVIVSRILLSTMKFILLGRLFVDYIVLEDTKWITVILTSINRWFVQDLAEVFRANAKEMLQSQWGTEVIYEVLLYTAPLVNNLKLVGLLAFLFCFI